MPCGIDCHTRNENIPLHTPANALSLRRFNPNWNNLYHGSVHDLIDECPHCRLQKIRIRPSPAWETVDHNSIVISIDGVVQDANTPEAEMVFGIFWGTRLDTSLRNVAGRIVSSSSMTAAAPILFAARYALQEVQILAAERLREGWPRFCKVLIMTDSEYLVRGISQCPWREPNGIRFDRHYIERQREFGNERLFREVDDLVRSFERDDIPVWFWKISPGDNQEARALSNIALRWDVDGEVYAFDVSFLVMS